MGLDPAGRKSAIGWEPYFNAVLAAGNTKVAAGFVAKCTGVTAQERCEMWVKCGMVAEGGKELAKVKDVNGLEVLRSKTSDRAASVEIERIINQLRPKK